MAIRTPGAVSGGSLGITDEYTLDGTEGKTSVVWSIPPRIGTISIQVYVAVAGSFRVEGTASPLAKVEAGTAKWYDLLGADQSASILKSFFASLTAVRISRISTGTHECCIRGQ